MQEPVLAKRADSRNLLDQINPDKLDKYLVQFSNGELHRLDAWLPNLLSIGGIVDRETYDYRTDKFRRNNQVNFNTHKVLILQKIEKLIDAKQDILAELANLKLAVDQYHMMQKQKK